MKAILLAAGEGSRLRPLTVSKPKPMVRVANRPIAAYALEALVANGVRDVTFVVGYQRAKVQQFFGDGPKFGARIQYVFQEALLGTAHALSLVPEPQEDFLVLAADNVVDAGLIKRLLEAPAGRPAVAVHRSMTPSKYGVVQLEGDRIASIEEKPEHPQSQWVNTGVYRFPASYYSTIAALVDEGLLTMPEVLAALIDSSDELLAVRCDDLWSDAVHPWDLLRMHAELLRRTNGRPDVPSHVHVEGPVMVGRDVTFGPGVVLGAGTCIGDNVQVRANSVLEGCVIYDDVQIEPFAYIQNSVIGAGARLGPRFTALSGPAQVRTRDGWYDVEEFGAVVGEDARVSGNVTLLPGAIVGNKVRLGTGRIVGGTIDDGTVVL